jgi:hypothetical protein
VKTRASTASAVSLGLYVKDAHTFHTGDIGQWTSDVWDLVRPPTVNTLDKWLPLEPEGSGEIRIKIEFEAN